VDPSLYEAAEIEGQPPVRPIRQITIPLINPIPSCAHQFNDREFSCSMFRRFLPMHRQSKQNQMTLVMYLNKHLFSETRMAARDPSCCF
jgi:ABC-type sugar transport system permease subunit